MTLRIHKSCMYPLLSRTCNRNKFENSSKEGLIFYYKTNGITFSKKTCGCKSHYYCKYVWKRSKFFVKRKRRKITNKKKWLCLVGQFLNFFSIKNSIKRRCAMKRIFRRLGSFNCHELFTNSICEKHVVKMLSFVFVSKLNYPCKRQFSQEILPRLVEKTSQ